MIEFLRLICETIGSFIILLPLAYVVGWVTVNGIALIVNLYNKMKGK